MDKITKREKCILKETSNYINMDKFPQSLSTSNDLSILKYNEDVRKLREELYYFLLRRKDEDDYYDLEKFNKMYVNNMQFIISMVGIVGKELFDLGWNVEMGLGNTGLFIWSKTKPHILNEFSSI